MSDSAAAFARLAATIARHYRKPAGTGGALLDRAATILAACASPDLARAGAARKPVRRFMPEIARLAAAGPMADIAEAFAAVEPGADWLQNPNYTVETGGAAYLEAYGYVELVGPGRVFASESIRVGLLALGPRLHYRDHRHPAEEVYHVVAGRASWWRDGEDWREAMPGSAIHHPPNRRHATRTGAEPLLALYCWGGDIGMHARLVAE